MSIEKVLEKLVVQYWFRENDEESIEQSSSKIKERINIVSMELTAELGRTSVTVEEFLRLAVGDVVSLETRTEEPVHLLIEEEPGYYAKPGIIGKNIGLQILDQIDKDVEVMSNGFLSQEEINALLNGDGSQGEEAKKKQQILNYQNYLILQILKKIF